MIAWGLGLHFVEHTGIWELQRTPHQMLVTGPYRFSRNPMYVLELVMWFGWVIFYGSAAVLAALIVEWAVFAFVLIPSEERQLESRFGDAYVEYKKSVPRWLGLPHPGERS